MVAMLTRPLAKGAPIPLWRLSATHEARYDVTDQPMSGEMDPFFFVTKHKNFIPHEYPCRTQFAAERRGRRPIIAGAATMERVWLLFEGADAAAVESARAEWRRLTGAGIPAQYWSDEAGRWQMKTEKKP